MFMILIERATFSGSSQSTVSGLPVFTPQKPHERVQMFPKIINVAVPSPQHSPIFGQLPEVQMVFNWYLSTKPRSSVYFSPIGSLTLSHFGFPIGNVLSKTLSIGVFFCRTKIMIVFIRYVKMMIVSCRPKCS